MLLGGAAWSELPISALRQAVLSGLELEFVGNVKTVSNEQVEVAVGNDFDLTLATIVNFSVSNKG